MDFHQRFKGRTTLIKKQGGIDSLISSGGIPVKIAGTTPMRTPENMSLVLPGKFEDEVDIMYMINDKQLFPNSSNSPKFEIVKKRQLHASDLEVASPRRSIDNLSPLFGETSHKKGTNTLQANPTLQPNVILPIVKTRRTASVQRSSDYQRFIMMMQGQNDTYNNIRGQMHQNSNSIVSQSGDFDPSFTRQRTPYDIYYQEQPKRSSLAKEGLAKPSTGQQRVLDSKEEQITLPIRKFNSLGSKPNDFESFKFTKHTPESFYNKLLTSSFKNAKGTVSIDLKGSSNQLYGKIVKKRLNKMSDNQFRFEKMTNIFNKEPADMQNTRTSKAQYNQNLEVINEKEKEIVKFIRFLDPKKEKNANLRYSNFPKLN